LTWYVRRKETEGRAKEPSFAKEKGGGRKKDQPEIAVQVKAGGGAFWRKEKDIFARKTETGTNRRKEMRVSEVVTSFRGVPLWKRGQEEKRPRMVQGKLQEE